MLEQGNQLDAFVESSIEVLAGNGDRDRVESGNDEQSLVNALSPPRRPGTNNRSGADARNGNNDTFMQGPQQQNVRSRAQANGVRREVGMADNRRAGGRGGRRRLVRRSDNRTLRDMPDVLAYDSEELVVDGYVQSPESLYNEDSEDEEEDSASDASDLDSSPEVVRHRYQVNRANVHEVGRRMRHEMEEE